MSPKVLLISTLACIGGLPFTCCGTPAMWDAANRRAAQQNADDVEWTYQAPDPKPDGYASTATDE